MVVASGSGASGGGNGSITMGIREQSKSKSKTNGITCRIPFVATPKIAAVATANAVNLPLNSMVCQLFSPVVIQSLWSFNLCGHSNFFVLPFLVLPCHHSKAESI